MTTKNSIPCIPCSPTLESLVPPLDLCNQIPEGKFENSALVWTFDDRLMPRTIMIDGVRHYYRGFPAPTLQEILVTMKHLSISLGFSIHPLDWRWYIYVNDQKSNDGTRIKEDHDDPTTAALKLWLELNPSEVKP